MKCQCCGSETTARPGKITPFAAQRFYDGSPPPLTFETCAACGFRFYWPRPSDEQFARFYQGYRDAEYQRARQQTEAWYTPEFNASLEGPRPHMDRLVPQAGSCLDYGGGDGRYIPSRIPERYVQDLSDVEPIPGVKRWGGEDVELTMLCHVLEHVADPAALLCELPGRLYVEVPLVTAAFVYMDEHISYFTPAALTSVLTSAGHSVERVWVEGIPVGWTDAADCIIGITAGRAVLPK